MKELEFAVAQLRHAYKQLVAGSVVDQKAFAVGLIGPQIEYLETILDDFKKQQAAVDEMLRICENPHPPTQKLIDLMRRHRIWSEERAGLQIAEKGK